VRVIHWCALSTGKYGNYVFVHSIINNWYLPAVHEVVVAPVSRGGVSSTRDLGPTMTTQGLGPTMTMQGLGPTTTARGQSIGISIGVLPQAVIVSRLDQLLRLGARIYFFHYS
jgi:hypothetical protein